MPLNKYPFFTLYLTSNNHYIILEDLLLVKRYLRRRFGYFINFSVQTNNLIKHKKISLLRSPFIYKKAQEQFLFINFKQKINIFFFYNIYSFNLIYWLFNYIFNIFKKITNTCVRVDYFFKTSITSNDTLSTKLNYDVIDQTAD